MSSENDPIEVMRRLARPVRTNEIMPVGESALIGVAERIIIQGDKVELVEERNITIKYPNGTEEHVDRRYTLRKRKD